MNRDRAERLAQFVQSQVWIVDLEPMIDAEILDRTEGLLELMDSRPDSLTGKTAIKLAAGRKALKDLKEEILGASRITTAK